MLVMVVFFIALDRKSGSAGMPRPISYAVFCLKKKRGSQARPGANPSRRGGPPPSRRLHRRAPLTPVRRRSRPTVFFFNYTASTEIYTLSLHDALPISKATSSTLYFDSLTVNAGNGGFLHCIQMDTSVNAANQVVSVGADIAFDADPKFFACLVRFESSSVPTTLPTAYDVYPLD